MTRQRVVQANNAEERRKLAGKGPPGGNQAPNRAAPAVEVIEAGRSSCRELPAGLRSMRRGQTIHLIAFPERSSCSLVIALLRLCASTDGYNTGIWTFLLEAAGRPRLAPQRSFLPAQTG